MVVHTVTGIDSLIINSMLIGFSFSFFFYFFYTPHSIFFYTPLSYFLSLKIITHVNLEWFYWLKLTLLICDQGDPVWSIKPETINDLLGLSLNFFFVVPILNSGMFSFADCSLTQ